MNLEFAQLTNAINQPAPVVPNVFNEQVEQSMDTFFQSQPRLVNNFHTPDTIVDHNGNLRDVLFNLVGVPVFLKPFHEMTGDLQIESFENTGANKQDFVSLREHWRRSEMANTRFCWFHIGFLFPAALYNPAKFAAIQAALAAMATESNNWLAFEVGQTGTYCMRVRICGNTWIQMKNRHDLTNHQCMLRFGISGGFYPVYCLSYLMVSINPTAPNPQRRNNFSSTNVYYGHSCLYDCHLFLNFPME